jgi:membrane protease YdiL (CAAX protease family)
MSEIQHAPPEVLSEGPDPVSTIPALDRRVRWAGLLIVLAVAILPFLISSTMHVVGITPSGSGSYSLYRLLNALLIEVTSLALLLYVLHRNGQSLGDIGFGFRFADIGHGILLIMGSRLVFRIAYWSMVRLYGLEFGHAPPRYVSPLVGAGVVASLLFAAINPFFEELIVRAFLITEATLLTGSAGLAVVLSVLLQTSYHLYQGIPNAIGDGLMFLVLSVYYVKTRRLWPVIVAHLWLDLHAVIFYHLHARPH